MQISLRVQMGGLLASPPWLCLCWSPFNRCSIQSIYNTHKITLKYLLMYFTIRIVDIQILNGFLHHNEIQLLAIIAIFAHTVGGVTVGQEAVELICQSERKTHQNATISL